MGTLDADRYRKLYASDIDNIYAIDAAEQQKDYGINFHLAARNYVLTTGAPKEGIVPFDVAIQVMRADGRRKPARSSGRTRENY